MISKELEEEVFQFLAGTFHQDIDSPEEALEEFIKEVTQECLKFTVLYLTEFINSDLSDGEKNNYIQSNADGIYFPAFGLEPLQWLDDVIAKIKDAIRE